jgi:putative endonuclease
MPDPSQDFYNKILGAAGEKQVEKYLRNKGYKILKRNYRTPFGEADLMALDGEDVVFIEVKTRTDDSFFATPAEAVTKQKQRRYRNIARYYLSGLQEEVAIRFDVIEVVGQSFNHIVGAFY